MPETKENKPRNRWKPIFAVLAYKHAKAGCADDLVARTLGVPRSTFVKWKKERPELREALELARREVPPEDSFRRYFYERLDPKLQSLWDRLEDAPRLGGGAAAVNNILADHGERARQELFLHALVFTRFSPARAMEKVGIDRRQLLTWMADPDFAELVEEVQSIKGDFFEEQFVRLVEEGHPQAILAANRSFNARRGYGLTQKLEVNHTGSLDHNVVLDLDTLDLDLDTRLKILDAVRRRGEALEKQRLLEARPPEERLRDATERAVDTASADIPEPVQDAEFTERTETPEA